MRKLWQWLQTRYLKWKYNRPATWVIKGYVFKIERISPFQYAEISKLIDEIITRDREITGPFNVISEVLLHFEDLAHILFDEQTGFDKVDWIRDLDGSVAWEIAETVVKKNPKLMFYALNIMKSFGLNVRELATRFQKIMALK